MHYRIILSPDAKADIRTVTRWYFDIRPQLSESFKAETLAILRRLQQNPYQFPFVYQFIRKALLRHFQYTVYFTLIAERVLVIAISHQRSRRPWEQV